MKTIWWVFPNKTIEFRVNWLEYQILRRIFNQKRIKFKDTKNEIKGYSVDTVITDEIGDLK